MKSTPPIYYEEKDYNEIKSLKEKLGCNWHDFFLDLVRFYKEQKGGKG